jgi:STE24 endopeptidase
MNAFAWLFLAAVVTTLAVKLWLGARHLAHVGAKRAAVPAEFSGQISLESHQRAADYTRAKTALGLVSLGLEVAVLLALTFGGGLQALQDVAASVMPAGIALGMALIVLLGLLMTVVELPLSLYSTFRVEARFGFNKMTPALFWKDFFKGLLLAAALGLPLVAVVLWLMEKSGGYWWLYAWLVWMGFNILLLAIYPTWIAPLFNKFTPMDNAALKQRIEQLLARCGFKVKGLMVMDGSLRSSHGNAYFTGFGKTKRIVFFDTLLERLSASEVEAVLAHELGHFKRRHVIKRIVWTFAASFFFLWLLGYLMAQPWFYQGLNVTTHSSAMALILFFLVIPNFTFLLQPLIAMYSRKHEFEADQYAAQNASAGDLVSALVKLYKDNASTLTPDPLHSMFYDSHPPALARIGRLQSQVST